MVQKGKIAAVLDGGRSVTITPYSGSTVSPAIAVPFFLVDALPVGTAVAYALFEDNTGIVLSRMDGDINQNVFYREEE